MSQLTTGQKRAASDRTPQGGADHDVSARVHLWTVAVLVAIMVVELVVVLLEGERLSAFAILAVMAVTLAPIVLGERLPVRIPAEFQVLVVVFVFAAIFLGEVRDYYARIWWWDIALHTSSGLLLGLLGFLLLYVLNENKHVELNMHPRFMALFACVFAVAMGAFWEIFEFAMDELFGMNMQKPMFDDPSGLTDTMWDLVVDTVGAVAISGLGWWYMTRNKHSFIESWIQKFINNNPQLFRSRRRPRTAAKKNAARS